MDAIPRLSGLDLARGLVRLGCRLTGSVAGYLLLERGPRAVTVPLVDELQPVLLRFVLRAAGVSTSQLAEALDRESVPPPSKSGMPPSMLAPPLRRSA